MDKCLHLKLLSSKLQGTHMLVSAELERIRHCPLVLGRLGIQYEHFRSPLLLIFGFLRCKPLLLEVPSEAANFRRRRGAARAGPSVDLGRKSAVAQRAKRLLVAHLL